MMRKTIGLMILCTGSPVASGDVIEYVESIDVWSAAAGDVTTVSFAGLDPKVGIVTNEYQDLGVYFPDWNDTLGTGSAFPIDGWGLHGYLIAPGEIHLVFDVPRRAIAAHYPGCLYIQVYREGQLLYTTDDPCALGEQAFLGLFADEPFDEVWLNGYGDPAVDDVYIGQPYILGDISGDAWVGPADLAELLAKWGPCSLEGLCLADVFPIDGGGDGVVGPADLATLLASWSNDCNDNGRDDSLDVALDGDCNDNGIPDSCDVTSGLSDDCNKNGLPDECEIIQPVATYAHDDGSQDTAVGTNLDELIWMNAFQVQKGAETVVAVEISWGYAPADIAIWSDPNNDGNPGDAMLLTVAANTPVQFPDHDPFRVIEVVPTFVGEAGDWYFVGARVIHPDNEFPAGIDLSTSKGNSWLTAGALDGFLLPPVLIDDLGLPGNWLIRAMSEQSADTNGNGELDECE